MGVESHAAGIGAAVRFNWHAPPSVGGADWLLTCMSPEAEQADFTQNNSKPLFGGSSKTAP